MACSSSLEQTRARVRRPRRTTGVRTTWAPSRAIPADRLKPPRLGSPEPSGTCRINDAAPGAAPSRLRRKRRKPSQALVERLARDLLRCYLSPTPCLWPAVSTPRTVLAGLALVGPVRRGSSHKDSRGVTRRLPRGPRRASRAGGVAHALCTGRLHRGHDGPNLVSSWVLNRSAQPRLLCEPGRMLIRRPRRRAIRWRAEHAARSLLPQRRRRRSCGRRRRGRDGR